MPERSIGWAIVGCGRVADRRVAPAIVRVDGASLVGFCSRDLNRAAEFAGRHAAPRAYATLEEVCADPAVSAVYIATPNLLHAEQAIACLNAGRHVLVEKPMAISVEQARRMCAAAQKADRTLGVVHQQRFAPANLHLIRCCDEGLLGRLSIIRAQIGIWFPPNDHWKRDPGISGGGAAMDLGPHALDIMLAIAGPVARVNAWTGNLRFDGPVEDFCSARLEFARGGVGLLETSFCVHAYGGRIEAYGSDGTYTADGSLQQAPVYRTSLRRSGEPAPQEQVFDASTDTFAAVIEDFTDAVRERRPPTVTAADGVAVLEAIEAIYASARSGKTVALRQ